jgi:hypothetical protein
VTNYEGKRRIKAVSKFSIVEPAINLNPTFGTIGTLVTISGQEFKNNDELTIKYDENDLKIINGDNTTNEQGKFSSIIAIPQSQAGNHLIRVGASGDQVQAQFLLVPRISLAPDSAAIGTLAKISGTDFAGNKKITITYDNKQIDIADGDQETDNEGRFISFFNIPESLAGQHTITVTDESGNKSSVKHYIEPEIRVSRFVQSKDMAYEIRIKGTGFADSEDVTLMLDDKRIATLEQNLRTDQTGSFAGTVVLPPIPKNVTGILKARGSKSSVAELKLNTINLTPGQDTQIDSPAPTKDYTLSRPKPMNPTNDVQSYTGIFSWEDSENGNGITYILQISQEPDFNYLLLERKGLHTSSYILGEDEILASTGEMATYYWRVKALDEAGNESEWSSTTSFVINDLGPAIPLWINFVLYSLGILSLGAIAFWGIKRLR